jgi:hypothetical protein
MRPCTGHICQRGWRSRQGVPGNRAACHAACGAGHANVPQTLSFLLLVCITNGHPFPGIGTTEDQVPVAVHLPGPQSVKQPSSARTGEDTG